MATSPSVPCTSGIAVLDVLHALATMVGSETIEAAKARLPLSLQADLEILTAVSWLPNSTFAALIDEVASCAGREPEALIDQAVRTAVDRTFKTVWRMFLRFTSDEALIKRTPIIYQRSRNTGQLSARLVEPGYAELLLTNWPKIAERHLRTIGISIQRVVELAGRREVRLTIQRTSEGGRYELRWAEG
jgi:hypothetical protein